MNAPQSLISSVIGNEIQKIPAVSWLLCAHRLNDQLKHAIQSCIDQTFTDFELLVVINGSNSDNIAFAVQSWFGHDPRLRIITTDIKYLTFSLTLGLHYARAPLIARMDSDDLSKRDRLERQVAFMVKNPDVVLLGTAYQYIDLNGNTLNKIVMPILDFEIRKSLIWRNSICHPSVIFRRSAVIEAGGYLGGIHAEDYDLWVRLMQNPKNHFANLEESLIYYRVVGIGVARGSRISYASVAASQIRNFIQGAGVVWLIASIITSIKAVLNSTANWKIK
jgi:cellulose synthase/poly-beta-1,6-N-acetylglucosamine synthase-like glycosyltransferase